MVRRFKARRDPYVPRLRAEFGFVAILREIYWRRKGA